MSFKGNVGDQSSSRSYKIRKILQLKGAVTLIHDPYLPECQCVSDILEECDGVIIGAPHKEYLDLQIKKPMVDVWGALNRDREIKLYPRLRSTSLPVVCVTGSAGFIGGYVVNELLDQGFYVIGVDNYSKYGRVIKDYDTHPNYEFHRGDVKDVEFMKKIALRCDYMLACAAMIGGISYFHELAYTLLAENDRIIASTFDAAVHAFQHGHLKKIIILSSSMVFESTTIFPTPESEITKCPPPQSTYGFQKLACEYYAKGAWEQFGLPYTIVRPFNCVGIGEYRALCDHDIMSGNIKLAMSHVVPDLIQKILKGQNPLRILGAGTQIRHYTYGGDLAKGIRLCIDHPNSVNEDFNISTQQSTTVIELAEMIWKKVKGPDVPFVFESDPPFKYDVQKRVPDTAKAKGVLGFEAVTDLDQILDELIPWIQTQIKFGNI